MRTNTRHFSTSFRLFGLIAALTWPMLTACDDGSATGTDGAASGPLDGGPSLRDGDVPLVDAGPPPPPPIPLDCDAGPTAAFFGNVTTLAERTPLAGARVCVLDHPEVPCAITDAAGFYELPCAPLGDAAIAFSHEGFASAVWLWSGQHSKPEDLSVSLARDPENTAYLAPTGMAYPDGRTSLVTVRARGSVDGLVVRARSGISEGVFYSADEGGRVDPSATALPNDQELAFALVRPFDGWDELELALESPSGRSCRQLGGAWAARDGAPSAVRVLVRPSWETMIWVECD